MIDLIARLRARLDDRRAWGLTSHMALVLLAQDTSDSPWYVTFEAVGAHFIDVKYRMPEAMAPWRGAQVHGEARSLGEAIEMIVTAMERSGGWSA